jgi:hypothetical protein
MNSRSIVLPMSRTSGRAPRIRRILRASVLAAASLAAGAAPRSALAQGAPVSGAALVTASPNPSVTTVGSTVVVTLRVGLAGVIGRSASGATMPAVLGGYQVSVVFDKTRLRFESAAGGSSAGYTSGPVFSAPATANANGNVMLVGSQTAPTSPMGEVTVALLTFTTLASGSASLSAAPVSLVSALQPGPPAVGPASISYNGAATTVSISAGPPAPPPTPGPSLQFYSLAPCRIADTRSSTPPALSGGATRTFSGTGICGVPSTAKALAVNVTVTQPKSAGDLRLFPAGATLSPASAISYAAGQTRAANTVVGVNGSGAFAVRCDQTAGKTVHFILDVSGYFE